MSNLTIVNWCKGDVCDPCAPGLLPWYLKSTTSYVSGVETILASYSYTETCLWDRDGSSGCIQPPGDINAVLYAAATAFMAQPHLSGTGSVTSTPVIYRGAQVGATTINTTGGYETRRGIADFSQTFSPDPSAGGGNPSIVGYILNNYTLAIWGYSQSTVTVTQTVVELPSDPASLATYAANGWRTTDGYAIHH